MPTQNLVRWAILSFVPTGNCPDNLILMACEIKTFAFTLRISGFIIFLFC